MQINRFWLSLKLLLLMAGCAALPPAYAAEPPKLAPVLQPFVDRHTLAGAVVLVADPDKILDLEAVGWMDIAAQKQMRTDCVFWIASQSKPITAAALMILVDEGKVNVDDPVEKYLPEFKDLWVTAEAGKDQTLLKRPRHPILVREVLSHTSGLPFKSAIEEPTLDLFPLALRVRSYAMQALLFEPGNKSQYANAGINTAGRIVEVVSGMPFEKFLDARLFQPLGMQDTTFWPSARQLKRLAKAYKPNAKKDGLEECPISQLKYPLDDRERQPMPAGGLFSTANDLSLFYRMLANNGVLNGKRILSEKSVEQMTSDQSGEAHSHYGFGMGTNGKVFSHGGAYGTASAYDRERRLITIFLGQHAGWMKDGKTIVPTFQKAAAAAFAPVAVAAAPAADAHLIVGIPAETAGQPKAGAIPTVQPATKENITVFKEPGRYGGWPANHGLWQWGDELVAGFEVAWFKHATNDHAVDRSKPFENWQARSRDGGRTWTPENALPFRELGHEPPPVPLTAPLDFTAPDFALMFRFGSLHVGPSWFYVSQDRCRTWRGPFSFAVEGIGKICTRTDLVVLGQRDCLMFGSAAKSDDKEGRVFCARTTDGGLHWKLVSLVGPEPAAGYAIMPSTVRLASGALITTIRLGGGPQNNITAWRSDDLGQHWKFISDATPDIGSNPPALVLLKDGRLCLSYGCRRKPFGARARISSDEGRTWGPEIILRDDGLTGDLGYPRSVARPDGKVLTIYYFNGPRDEDRTIQGTLWAPQPVASAVQLKGPAVVDRVRFYPAPEREQALVGGKFSGSNVSPGEGFHVLAEIKTPPPRGAWGELAFANTVPYRWVRYEAPAGSRGNVAELEFYAGARKLSGGGFGTAGSLAPGGHWKTVFDGKKETWFNSNNADGQYVGLDLGEQASTARPVIAPGEGDWDRPQVVTLKCATPGATIRYTLDGTTPDAQDGQLYTGPLTVAKNTTLVAASFSASLAPSPANSATLWIGKPARQPMNSFHVGNSLTGNASRFRTFIRTAGGRDDFPAYLIGGSLTVRLWNDSHGADKPRWDETYAKAVHPLDYFTLQPRDFNVAEEADYAARFIKLIREKSPDVQPWLYAEWDEMGRARPTDKGEVPSRQMKKTFPALTWEESMGAMLLYNEEVQQEIAARVHDGKPVRILPTALALGWARALVDQGQFPGVPPGEANFYATFFEDHVHVNPNGCYLVALTWYAALYREPPEGKLLPIGTTLTAEQARSLQRLAWDVVKNYPDCGLYAEGAQPCDKPAFASDGKTITLASATPGAWCRYTLDGTTPTRTRGYIYCGVISVQPGIHVKAVAYRSGMADSAVAEMPTH